MQEEPSPISRFSRCPRRRSTGSSRMPGEGPGRSLAERGDIKRRVGWIAEGGSQVGLRPPVVASPKSRERLLWIAVPILTLAAADALGDPGSQGHARRSASGPVRGAPAGECELSRGRSSSRDDFARRPAPRPPRNFRGAAANLDSSTGVARSGATCRHRGRLLPVLVAGQPVHRLLCRRETEEGRGIGRARSDALRRADRPRGLLEHRGGHPFCAAPVW